MGRSIVFVQVESLLEGLQRFIGPPQVIEHRPLATPGRNERTIVGTGLFIGIERDPQAAEVMQRIALATPGRGDSAVVGERLLKGIERFLVASLLHKYKAFVVQACARAGSMPSAV